MTETQWRFQHLPCDHRVAIDVLGDGSKDHIIPTGGPLEDCCRTELANQALRFLSKAISEWKPSEEYIDKIWENFEALMNKATKEQT